MIGIGVGVDYALFIVTRYRQHLDGYLGGQLKESIGWAMDAGFVSPDYIERTRARFDSVMSKIGIEES